MKLNLGCGRDYKEGWVNTDVSRETRADMYFDIAQGDFPIENDVCEEIYCSVVLEQIQGNFELLRAMNECHRVMKKGGLFTIVVPNAKYAIAHQDPFDVRKFTIPTFDYFVEGTRQYKLYGSVYGFKGWEMVSVNENDRGILTVILRK